MSASIGQALRVLAPNDVRLVWRDSFMVLILAAMPLACLVLRWLLPFVTEMVAEWVALEHYWGLIVGYMLGQQPVLVGYIIGILFIEERDEGTLLALRTSPLSISAFLGYRLLAGMLLSIGLSALCVPLAGLVSVPPLAVLATAALAALAVPIVALAYALFLKNKLQAVASGKLVQGWAGLPAILFFAPPMWASAGSVFAPIYFPMRLFWTASQGRPEWWLLLPGALVLGAMVAWLLWRFGRGLEEG